LREEFLPLCRPSITEAEIAEVTEVLRSGWITSGPRVERFEEAFALQVGARCALTVCSATCGMHLTLSTLGVGPGDEVITVSLTWPSTVNMIFHCGACPVFADIDRDTLQIDPASVEALVSPRTKAVIPVHFGGQPADLSALREVCHKHGLTLIEDAAHALGTEYGGNQIGYSTTPAVFSFHAIKNLTTAEGGMITTGDPEFCERLRRQRFHGIDQDAWTRSSKGGNYDLLEPGWKYNMTDIQAAIGMVQLGRLAEINERRANLAARYDELLDDVPEISRPGRVSYPSRHAWHLYPILVDEERCGLSRDAFRSELRSRNIGSGLHFLPVHGLTFYRRTFPVPNGRLENTEWVGARILSLPLFPDMSREDVEDVVAAVRDIVRCQV
jgi:UDP-4-amino-4-deoxy-L-arabinose-oxoglutarate aminotransferase